MWNPKRFQLSLILVCGLYLFLLVTDGAEAAETVRINGSGSALEMMKPLIRAYRKATPEVRIEMEKPLGSSGAVKALVRGALDLAVSSKPLKPEEAAQGLQVREYGRTPLLVVVEKGVPKRDVTTSELEAIYSGKVRKWPNGEPVRVVLRPETDIDTNILRGLSPGMNGAINAAQAQKGMIVAVTDPESVDAVVRTPGSIGASALTDILVSRKPLKSLTLNGIKGTPKSLADGTYPLAKEIRFVTAAKAPPAVLKLLAFIYSPHGRAIAEKAGVLVTTGNKVGK